MLPKNRDVKKAEKSAKKKKKSLSLARKLTDTTNNSKVVKIPASPILDKTPKNVASRPQYLKKNPKFNANPSIYQSQMTWCAEIADIEGVWSWVEARRWSDSEWGEEITVKLNQLEGCQWSEIAAQTTGEVKKRKKRRRLHHSQELHELNAEAQQRWIDLDLEQFETAYRFRFGGRKRAWGFQSGSHFYLIWWERNHNISPL